MNAADERFRRACETLLEVKPGSIAGLCAALEISSRIAQWRAEAHAWIESLSLEEREALRCAMQQIDEDLDAQAEQGGTAT